MSLMSPTDRVQMSFVIDELKHRRDESLEALQSGKYYAFEEALSILRRRFPEMFEVNERRIKTE